MRSKEQIEHEQNCKDCRRPNSPKDRLEPLNTTILEVLLDIRDALTPPKTTGVYKYDPPNFSFPEFPKSPQHKPKSLDK